jgi:serpin B
MKSFSSLLLLVCLSFGFPSCHKSDTPDGPPQPAKPIELTTKQGERLNADNRFAFTIFKEVSALSGPNTFFSPLSLNFALGMLYNGASGDTRSEMALVLGMADFTDTEINEYYQKMMQTLLNIDPLTQLGIANSIWYRNGLSVKQPFIDVNQKYFDAMVKALDFNKPDAADIINRWCADKTKDRIREIIEKPISGDMVMYLINALYFKSKWQSEFDKKNTQQEDFTKANNQKKKVAMMEQTTSLPYYANQYVQCIEMPYGNQAFSMVAMLPAENTDIDQLIDYLDNTSWKNILDNLHEQKVWLKLPKFKIECEIPLNEPVMNVGTQQIYYGGLKNISDNDLAVSNIKQKTFVEVNEEGTEAAAVTVVGDRIMSVEPSTPIQFFANRPFLYLIKEKSTGAILFIGRMDEPVL